MDFTPLSTNSKAASCRGATIVELLIGLLIGVLVAMAVVSYSMYSGRSLAGLFGYTDMQYSSRKALDLLSRDIRQCAYLQSFSANTITLRDTDGELLTYEYSPESKTFTRIKGDQRTVLLTQCDSLSFAAYKRNPKPGTFDHDVSTVPASSKVINVSWKCSRSILGVPMTTESLDSAKIVIRKN